MDQVEEELFFEALHVVLITSLKRVYVKRPSFGHDNVSLWFSVIATYAGPIGE